MRAETLGRSLGGKRYGRYWQCRCVLPQNHRHGDRNPSLLIRDGDVAPLLKCMAGCDSHEIIAELRRQGLWKQTGRVINHHLPIIQHLSSDDADQKQICARRLWDDGNDPRGTLAERYLVEARALSLPHEVVNRVFRFHPECPFGNERAPALLAAFRPIQGDLHPDTPQSQSSGCVLIPAAHGKSGKP